VVAAPQPYGIAELVLSGFLRIVTHPRVFTRPTPLPEALAFCEVLRSQPNATVLSPGPRHWGIFAGLFAEAGARGNLVPDAYLAALAIETGSEWISTDGDYRRFKGLRLRHPLVS
jgi:toxin-antitoxin system PIN domain toxin